MAHALPTYDEVRQSYVKSDSLLLDRHGEVLYELRTDKVRRRLDWTSLKNISPALRVAVVKAEDKRFYEHPGFDYKSMGAAVIEGLTSESLRGASTITMQLASLLDRELQAKKERKSIWQKGKQVIKAWEIEKGWSKQEILEAYLNLVTFRGELQGIAAASRGIFGKDPHGLDQSESLILASLIRSPNASSTELVRRVSHLNKVMDWQIGEEEIHSKVRQLFFGPNLLRPRMDLAPHIARQLLKGKAPWVYGHLYLGQSNPAICSRSVSPPSSSAKNAECEGWSGSRCGESNRECLGLCELQWRPFVLLGLSMGFKPRDKLVLP